VLSDVPSGISAGAAVSVGVADVLATAFGTVTDGVADSMAVAVEDGTLTTEGVSAEEASTEGVAVVDGTCVWWPENVRGGPEKWGTVLLEKCRAPELGVTWVEVMTGDEAVDEVLIVIAEVEMVLPPAEMLVGDATLDAGALVVDAGALVADAATVEVSVAAPEYTAGPGIS